MSKFAPCSQCQRHVRVADALCPFCGVATAGLSARTVSAPSGTKRALLFALGTTLAAACSDESNSDVSMMGDPAMTGSGTSPAPTMSPNTTSTAGSNSSAPAPSDSEVTAQPVYGAPIASDTPLPDFSAQAMYGAVPAPSDSWVAVPVYGGAPAPTETVEDLDAGAPAPGEDAAAASDAASDATANDAGLEEEDPGPILPLYGAVLAPLVE